MSGKVYLRYLIRQNIAGWCQQPFCFQKFVDNSLQCFTFTTQTNFPAHNFNFHWRWWDWIQATFYFLFFTLALLRLFLRILNYFSFDGNSITQLTIICIPRRKTFFHSHFDDAFCVWFCVFTQKFMFFFFFSKG